MPGVVVNTGVRVGPTGTDTTPSSTLFIAGEAERGPVTEPVLARSMAEFEKWFGDFVASGVLHQHAQCFFEEGGTSMYAVRVVDGAAAAGTLALNGRSGVGTALTVTAANPGTWSSDLGIQITDGVSANTYRVKVYLKGELVYSTGDLSSNEAAASALNAAIPYLVVATAGVNGNYPPVAGPTALTGGDEDLTNVTDNDVVDALTLFGEELGTGAVALPSRNGTTVWDGLLAHAVAHRRIALCALANGETADDAKSAAADYAGDTDGAKADASHMAFYWPHVKAPDGLGGSRVISPESFVAAARAKAHRQSGPWRPGAGQMSAGRFVTGLSDPVTKALGDALDQARVNALRVVENTVRVYGARSVSGDEANWRFITYRDTLNTITVQAEKALEKYVFSVVDGRKSIFANIASDLVTILEVARAKGGVFELIDANGQLIDRGYTVEISEALNPNSDLAAGIVRARVGIRVSSVADIVAVTITKSALTTAV